MVIHFLGEELHLMPQRALWWPRREMLLIADLHVGKDAAFRAAAIPIPHSPLERDLARLSEAIRATAARRVAILGDLAHHRSGWSAVVLKTLDSWRATHAGVEMTLVRGNHDQHAGDPPPSLGFHCVTGPVEAGPFRLAHIADGRTGYTIAGHLHPAVKLRRKGIGTCTLPCFYFGEAHALLPAFGSFTGVAIIRPKPDELVYAVGDGEVLAIPTSSGGR